MIRIFAKSLLGLAGAALLAAVGVLAVLFFRPDLILSAQNADWALRQTKLLESWSWDFGKIETRWLAWNRRRFVGEFNNLALTYKKEGMETWAQGFNLSWDFIISFNFRQGFRLEELQPLSLTGKRLAVVLPKAPEPARQAQQDKPPPDIHRYWRLFWNKNAPEMILDVEEILLKRGDESLVEFNLSAEKRRASFLARSLGFELSATPRGVLLEAPSKLKLPYDVPMARELVLTDARLEVLLSEERIFVSAKGELLGVELEAQSWLELPLRHAPGSVAFLKNAALNTRAEARASGFKRAIKKALRSQGGALPAPFNALDGSLRLEAFASEHYQETGASAEEIELKALLTSDLEGGGQALNFQTLLTLVFDLAHYQSGPTHFEFNLEKLVLQLPRLPKTSLPPRFYPDGRIHQKSEEFDRALAPEKKEAPLDLDMRLRAEGKNYVGLKTNLLDETLKANLDIRVEQGAVHSGHIQVMPMKTALFNRKIELEEFSILFSPDVPAEAKAEILFDLPEYDVTLRLEGPVSAPRRSLESNPPLPEEDIYAVLLFGRPMIDLSGGDKNAAERARKILSQGLLSIGVLYYLSGTPIQAIVYDPDSEQLSAQIALDEKRSVTVGEGSVGVRQSLGGGWYVDTSRHAEEGYGLMLERIIAY